MNTKTRYRIPTGTDISWRNIDRDLKLTEHRTEQDLWFDEIQCTGDGGLKLYFELGCWLIVVDADQVQTGTDWDIDFRPKAAPVLLDNETIGSQRRSRPSTSIQGSVPLLSLPQVPCLQTNRE